jgi:hypothetical protein
VATPDVRVVLPTGFSPIAVGRYGTDRMRKSLRDMAGSSAMWATPWWQETPASWP